MANLNVERDRLFDPALLIQQLPYINNGLTYVSDNTSIHPRDEAGNIILQENSETNPLLIIEPTQVNYTVATTNRVLDTTFRYFKFPIAASADIPEINTDDLQLDLSALEFDGAYARYKPSEDRTVPVQTIPAGILMDEVVQGQPQSNTNCYTITKDVKNSGKDLLFRIKLTHTFNSDIDSVGSIYWSLMKTGPNTVLNRKWRGEFASTRLTGTVNFNALIRDFAEIMFTICDTSAGQGGREPWDDYRRYFNPNAEQYGNNNLSTQTRLSGNQDDAWDYVRDLDPKKAPGISEETYKNNLNVAYARYNAYKNAVDTVDQVWGFINNGSTQTVYVNERIPNSDFEIGDIFQIGAYSGQDGHTILNNQSYWVISDASKNVDLWNEEITE